MSSRRDQLNAISQPETSAPQNVTEPGVAASAAFDPARDDDLEARIARRRATNGTKRAAASQCATRTTGSKPSAIC